MIVSLAEAVGFFSPIAVGLATYWAGWPAGAQAAAVLAAGTVEGVCLGSGQALALPLTVDRPRFVALTAIAALLAWSVGLGISALAPTAPVAAALLGLVAGPAALLGMGGLQWLELGRHARGAGAWIGFTALAWTLALPWSFAPSPLVDESTPLASHLVIWGCGGWLMGTTMAIVTWAGARRLVPLGASAAGQRPIGTPA